MAPVPFLDNAEYLEELERLLACYLRCGARRLLSPDTDIASGLYLRGTVISKPEVECFFRRALEDGPGEDGASELFDLARRTDAFFARLQGDESFPLELIRRKFALDFLEFFLLLLSYFVKRNRKYERIYGLLQDQVSAVQPTVGLGVALCELYAPVPAARVLTLLQDPVKSALLVEQADFSDPLRTTLQIPPCVFYALEEAEYRPAEFTVCPPEGEAFPRGINRTFLDGLVRDARRVLELGRPMALFLSGPQGIGKSYSVRYAANRLDRGCLELRADCFLALEGDARRLLERDVLLELLLHDEVFHL